MTTKNEHAPEPLVLDTRPIFASKRTPCEAIDRAVAELQPGQTLTLIVPFEPVPLYSKLGNMGFCHHTEQRIDGTWQVEFHRAHQAQKGCDDLKPEFGQCRCR